MGIGSPSLYAAFGSKEALYAESLGYYRENFRDAVLGQFFSSRHGARGGALAAHGFGSVDERMSRRYSKRGCMVALSSVGSEGHAELGALVHAARAGRAGAPEGAAGAGRSRMARLPGTVDTDALARFVLTVQSGMSILARDGASRADLEDAAKVAMAGWDAWVA